VAQLIATISGKEEREEASYLVLGVQDGERPLGSHGPGVGLVVLEPENAGEVSAEAAVKLLGLAQDGIVLAVGVF